MTSFPFRIRYMLLLPILGLTIISSGCLPDSPTGPDVWETLAEDSEFSTFVTALERTGIDESLKKGFIYTVFAPTNEAFDAWLQSRNLASINDVPRTELLHLMWYHVSLGEFDLSQESSGYTLTLSPASPDSNAVVLQFRSTGSSVILNDTIRITSLNIAARNGVINEVNAVLTLPSAMDILSFNGSLSIMEEAVRRANLSGKLGGDGEATILAPTNSVFETFFDRKNISELDDLTDEEVKSLVEGHIIDENIVFFEVINASVMQKESLSGTDIRLSSYRQGEMIVNDSIGVPIQDLQGTNGVIHIMTKVIDPQ